MLLKPNLESKFQGFLPWGQRGGQFTLAIIGWVLQEQSEKLKCQNLVYMLPTCAQ
jgi:hypothetical protein